MRDDHGWSKALGGVRRRGARPFVRAGACVFAITCLLGTGAVPAGSAERREVFVLGDSVTVGATPAIEAGAAAHGWSVAIDAEIGRTTTEGAEILASMHGDLPSVVVVELGNNDGASPAAYAARVDAVMRELAGVDHVVWYTMTPFASWVPAANAVLQDAADRWPNMELADWATVAERTPGALAGPGPHLQPAGGEAFAALAVPRDQPARAARTRRGVVPRGAARATAAPRRACRRCRALRCSA